MIFLKKILLTISVLLFGWITFSQNIFVAPDGTAGGRGTIDSPLDMWTAFKGQNSGGNTQPGDTIFMRGGTYLGCNIEVSCGGTPSEPVVVMPFNHETVIIMGNCETSSGSCTWRLNGSYIIARDLIITQTERDRVSNEQASGPSDMAAEGGVVVRNPGDKLINCIVHNTTSSGINSPTTAENAEIYGNIVFHNGWHETSNNGKREFGHGHALYFQNDNGTKLISDNIFCKVYGYGVQFYSSVGTPTDGSLFYNNISIMSGTLNTATGMDGAYSFLIDGGGTPETMVVEYNDAYQKGGGSCFSVGYVHDNDTVTFNHNIAHGGGVGFLYHNYRQIIARHNIAIQTNRGNNQHPNRVAMTYYIDNSCSLYQYDIDSSVYYVDNSLFRAPCAADHDHFAGWQEDGLDIHGEYHEVAATTDIPNIVRVYPNKYEQGRGHIVIHNTQKLSAVAVDLSGILDVGQQYYIYDVEDLRQPIMQGTYSGGTLGIPTNQTSCFPIIGTELISPNAVHSEDTYGTFLVMPRELHLFGDPVCEIDVTLSPYTTTNSITVDFTTTEECSDINIDLAGSSGNVVHSANSILTGYTFNMTDVCDSCGSGTYTVTLSSGDATASQDFVYDKPRELEIISCAPSSTYDTATVVFYSPNTVDVFVNVTNDSGTEVLQQQFAATEGEGNDLVIDLSGQSSGGYKIKITEGQESDSCNVTKKDVPESLNVNSYSPNPTYDSVNVSFFSPSATNIEISVKNSSGSVVQTKTYGASTGDNTIVIDLSRQPEGDYAITFNDGNDSVTITVIKVRPFEIISCSPDTTYDVVTVKFYSPQDGNMNISVFNSSGTQIYSQGYFAKQGESNSIDINLTGNNADEYTIKLTDENFTVTCEVTKIDRPRQLEIISCSPNPTDGVVIVKFYSPYDGNVTVVTVNSSGTEVNSGGYSGSQGENNNVSVDLTGNTSGVYIIKLSNNTQSDSCSVTKQDTPPQPQPLSITNYTKETYGEVTVNFYSPANTSVDVTIVNTTYNKTFQAVEGNNTLTVDISGFDSGDYEISLSDGTSNESCIVTKLQIEESIEFKFESVSPNPTLKDIVIEFYNPFAGSVHIEVHNDAGKRVKDDSAAVSKGLNRIVVDLADLDPGQYEIIIDNGESKLAPIRVISQAYYK